MSPEHGTSSQADPSALVRCADRHSKRQHRHAGTAQWVWEDCLQSRITCSAYKQILMPQAAADLMGKCTCICARMKMPPAWRCLITMASYRICPKVPAEFRTAVSMHALIGGLHAYVTRCGCLHMQVACEVFFQCEFAIYHKGVQPGELPPCAPLSLGPPLTAAQHTPKAVRWQQLLHK